MFPTGWSRLEPLGGQCHDPGNLECNGGEEGGMGLVPRIVLHRMAGGCLEQGIPAGGTQGGALAVWKEAGGGKKKQVIYSILFLFLKIFIGV